MRDRGPTQLDSMYTKSTESPLDSIEESQINIPDLASNTKAGSTNLNGIPTRNPAQPPVYPKRFAQLNSKWSNSTLSIKNLSLNGPQHIKLIKRDGPS